MLTPDEIDAAVEKSINDLLKRGGHPTGISSGTNLGAAGLTSEDGIELACDLEARLGIVVPGKYNPLFHETGKRFRTPAEIKAWARSRVGIEQGV